MDAVPRLKPVTCAAAGSLLLVSLDPRHRIEINDEDGEVRALLGLLAEGTRTITQLTEALSVGRAGRTESDVRSVLAQLDALGWLEDAAAAPLLDDRERERFHSNLAFFDAFTALGTPRETFQRRLTDAHVVVLGAGGLGSCVLQSLAGFGVGRLTLLDHDTVELRNFARQFTYFPDQVGRRKVDQVAAWLAAFHPEAEVTAVHARVDGPDDVRALLADADLLISAIDTPDEVDLWVNEACVGAGVPFIRAGLAYVQGLYWSVDPGRSACRECLERHRRRLADGIDATVAASRVVLEPARINRGIGPVAQVLGGLAALEGMRYLTGLAAPISAGCYRLIDFDGSCETSTDPWPRDPACPVCATAGRRTEAVA
jgi:molybdopterin/thiamine biosynthesis adenylyltransferase